MKPLAPNYNKKIPHPRRTRSKKKSTSTKFSTKKNPVYQETILKKLLPAKYNKKDFSSF